MNPKPTTPVGTQRVFIGIPIDKNAQQQINELLTPIRNLSQEVRWVAEKNRHLTLAFLGNKPDLVVKNLLLLFDAAYQQEFHFQYKLSTMARFPGPEGKVIALVQDSTSPLKNLFRITLELLQRNNIEFERQDFRPHITLGRIKRPRGVKSDFDQRTKIILKIDNTALYKSTLTESGPVYSILKQTRLATAKVPPR